MVAKHTDMPWYVNFNTDDNDWEVLSEENGEHVASTGPIQSFRAEANAKFISLACNSHADLVAALGVAYGYAQMIGDISPGTPEMLRIIDAALAKAATQHLLEE